MHLGIPDNAKIVNYTDLDDTVFFHSNELKIPRENELES